MESKIMWMTVLVLAVWCTGPSFASYKSHQVSKIMEATNHVLGAHKGIKQISVNIFSKGHGDLKKHYNYDPKSGVVLENLAGTAHHCVGDITRAFSAFLVQTLLQETNHTWETPIVDILGHQLVLPDMYRSGQISLTDIFTMRSGLGGLDIVPVVGPFDIRDMIRHLRYLPVEGGFRTQAIHNNVLFTLVDSVVESLSGLSFEAAMQERLLKPLGIEQAKFFWDVSLNKQLAYSVAIQSASTLCLKDLAISKIFRFMASKGQDLASSEFMAEEKLEELYQGIQVRGNEDTSEEGFKDVPGLLDFTWDINTRGFILGQLDGGHRVLSLSGSFAFHDQSLLTYLPDHNVGVFVSFYGPGNVKDFAAKFLLTERLLRLELGSYSSSSMSTKEQTESAFNQMTRFKPFARQVGLDDCPRSSRCGVQRPLDEYAGEYKNFAFGEVNVVFNASGNEALTVEYGQAVYELRPATFANDSFSMRPTNGNYYTATSVLRGVSLQCRFRAPQDDPETRIFSMDISGIDQEGVVEFSLNPREPAYEKEEVEVKENVSCSSTSLVVSIWCIALAIFAMPLIMKR